MTFFYEWKNNFCTRLSRKTKVSEKQQERVFWRDWKKWDFSEAGTYTQIHTCIGIAINKKGSDKGKPSVLILDFEKKRKKEHQNQFFFSNKWPFFTNRKKHFAHDYQKNKGVRKTASKRVLA